MGLYLCVFDGDEDIEGIDVGPYSDFNSLRDCIIRELENGVAGSRFPVFINHSDSDGEWSQGDCEKLETELAGIVSQLRMKPPNPFCSKWQEDLARSIGLMPQNCFESFIDVDGEFLLDRLYNLILLANRKRLKVLFQ